jgi:hypothetical protein
MKARKLHGIGRGLEAIGKTRFATLVFSAASIQRNIPAIKDVAASEVGFEVRIIAVHMMKHLH